MTAKRLRLDAHPSTANILEWSSVFFVGIKGVGMASLAVLLKQAGVSVSGADVAQSFVTDDLLRAHQIPVVSFEEAALPASVSGVVYSGAHKGKNNPLVQAALATGIPCLTLAEATGSLSRAKSTIVTCGVGGKSTTAAWLSLILEQAGMQPSYSVGVGTIPNLGNSGRWQAGQWFVVEGDEYVADPSLEEVTPRFLFLQPTLALCTGVAYDHPDVYSSWEDTVAAFRTLWERLPPDGALIIPENEPGIERVLAASNLQARVIRVGSSDQADVFWTWRPAETGAELSLTWKETSETLTAITSLPGEHNALNAALVAVGARVAGADLGAIQSGLVEFRSTPRRFEFVGSTTSGLQCFDDYAHHPRELAAIAQTLQTWFSQQNVTVAFQPHTFSRTKSLLSEFVEVLSSMPGELLVLPIFASAREAADDTIRSEDIVTALQQRGKAARFVQSHSELVEYLQTRSAPGVFITLGAGDIYTVYEHLTLHHPPDTLS